MNVLIIGKDPSVFESGLSVAGDARKRHQSYAKMLRMRCGMDSSIRYIGYAPAKGPHKVEALDLDDGLTLYPARSGLRVFFLWHVLRILPRVLHNWRPDLITVQTPWEEGSLGYLLSRILKAKFLPQVHFDLFSEYWLQEHWMNRWRRLVATYLIRRADGVRVVSHSLKRNLIDYLGIQASDICLVPVGVNFEPVAEFQERNFYKAKISPKLKNKPIILFVGRFYYPKNLTLWIDVAQQVARALPDVHFVMAGDGPRFTAIRLLVKERRLEDRFFFLGAVGYHALPEIYAAADIFLLTSNYEAYGRVIAESMLSGVPVVSTACAGPSDLIKDGESGFLLPLNDLEGLSKAVLTLLGNGDDASRMGLAGKRHVKKLFSTNKLVEKLIECWASV